MTLGGKTIIPPWEVVSGSDAPDPHSQYFSSFPTDFNSISNSVTSRIEEPWIKGVEQFNQNNNIKCEIENNDSNATSNESSNSGLNLLYQASKMEKDKTGDIFHYFSFSLLLCWPCCSRVRVRTSCPCICRLPHNGGRHGSPSQSREEETPLLLFYLHYHHHRVLHRCASRPKRNHYGTWLPLLEEYGQRALVDLKQSRVQRK